MLRVLLFLHICAVKKSNDLATFVEARLGKPSHLLEGDRLQQFLSQVCMQQLAPASCLKPVEAALGSHASEQH
jgi:hypothetical protein